MRCLYICFVVVAFGGDSASPAPSASGDGSPPLTAQEKERHAECLKRLYAGESGDLYAEARAIKDRLNMAPLQTTDSFLKILEDENKVTMRMGSGEGLEGETRLKYVLIEAISNRLGVPPPIETQLDSSGRWILTAFEWNLNFTKEPVAKFIAEARAKLEAKAAGAAGAAGAAELSPPAASGEPPTPRAVRTNLWRAECLRQLAASDKQSAVSNLKVGLQEAPLAVTEELIALLEKKNNNIMSMGGSDESRLERRTSHVLVEAISHRLGLPPPRDASGEPLRKFIAEARAKLKEKEPREAEGKLLSGQTDWPAGIPPSVAPPRAPESAGETSPPKPAKNGAPVPVPMLWIAAVLAASAAGTWAWIRHRHRKRGQ